MHELHILVCLCTMQSACMFCHRLIACIEALAHIDLLCLLPTAIHTHSMVKKGAKVWDQCDTEHCAKCLEYFDLQLTSGQISNQEDDPIFQMACQQVTRALQERLAPNIEIDTEDAKKVIELLRHSRLPKKVLVNMQLKFFECVKITSLQQKQDNRGGAHIEQTLLAFQNFLDDTEWMGIQKGTFADAVDILVNKGLNMECHYPSNLTLQPGAPMHPSHCTYTAHTCIISCS